MMRGPGFDQIEGRIRPSRCRESSPDSGRSPMFPGGPRGSVLSQQDRSQEFSRWERRRTNQHCLPRPPRYTASALHPTLWTSLQDDDDYPGHVRMRVAVVRVGPWPDEGVAESAHVAHEVRFDPGLVAMHSETHRVADKGHVDPADRRPCLDGHIGGLEPVVHNRNLDDGRSCQGPIGESSHACDEHADREDGEDDEPRIPSAIHGARPSRSARMRWYSSWEISPRA